MVWAGHPPNSPGAAAPLTTMTTTRTTHHTHVQSSSTQTNCITCLLCWISMCWAMVDSQTPSVSGTDPSTPPPPPSLPPPPLQLDLLYLHNSAEAQIEVVGRNTFMTRLEAAFVFLEGASVTAESLCSSQGFCLLLTAVHALRGEKQMSGFTYGFWFRSVFGVELISSFTEHFRVECSGECSKAFQHHPSGNSHQTNSLNTCTIDVVKTRNVCAQFGTWEVWSTFLVFCMYAGMGGNHP